jgi:hypothetical protein
VIAFWKRRGIVAGMAKKSRKIPAWRAFEMAVADFVRALDPSATVTHNAKPPDVHTKRPRQRDILVKATVCNFFPVTILISCKLKRRPLSGDDIDHFLGEMIGAGVPMGVICSGAGFTQPAIEKANALNISCCKLLQGEAPAIPQQLLFQGYVFRPRIGLGVTIPFDPSWQLITWGDIFEIETVIESQKATLLERIGIIGAEAMKKAIHQDGIPEEWESSITVSNEGNPTSSLTVRVIGKWRCFKARLEAHLLSGSYSFTDEKFIGKQSFPIIDAKSSHPGEGWEEIQNPPTPQIGLALVCFTNSAEQLREQLASSQGSIEIRASALSK